MRKKIEGSKTSDLLWKQAGQYNELQKQNKNKLDIVEQTAVTV